jgi:hypothetical protein
VTVECKANEGGGGNKGANNKKKPSLSLGQRYLFEMLEMSNAGRAYTLMPDQFLIEINAA